MVSIFCRSLKDKITDYEIELELKDIEIESLRSRQVSQVTTLLITEEERQIDRKGERKGGMTD